MTKNEVAFSVLVGGAFFLLAGLKGLFDLGMERLFDSQQRTPYAKELVTGLTVVGASAIVCLIAWSFL